LAGGGRAAFEGKRGGGLMVRASALSSLLGSGQSRKRESERRPGLAKPGFALKFASFTEFLCLSVFVPAVRVFPAAFGLVCFHASQRSV
jgi:hypothetical protein